MKTDIQKRKNTSFHLKSVENNHTKAEKEISQVMPKRIKEQSEESRRSNRSVLKVKGH